MQYQFIENNGKKSMVYNSILLPPKRFSLFNSPLTSKIVKELSNQPSCAMDLARAIGEGHRAAVIFVVQREDAHAFSPNDDADPLFGGALREARDAGVEVYAYRCRVSQEEIVLAEPLPVSIPDRLQKR